MDVIYGNVGEDLQLGEQKRTVDKAKELIFRSVAGSNCGDSDGGGRGRGLRGEIALGLLWCAARWMMI